MDTGHATVSDCPASAELAEFATGSLSRKAFERVARHVEQCPACEVALDALDDQADPLLSGLRQADAAPAGPLVPPELLAVAHSCRDAEAADGPRRVGKFELLEELGRGSFGHVFRARDSELGRTVAIKMLRAGRLAGREEVERLAREARSAAQLQHPSLVALYETGQTDDGLFYLVEEFVQGETLTARLRAGPVGLRAAAELVARVAEALDYAHRHGVVHRDVKPSNIQIDADGRPHLMDFGLAKRTADESSMTVDGDLVGTPAYLSPEQARGEGNAADGRADIYSLGVILYELMTGERPFRGNRPMLLLQVLRDEPRPPRQLNDKVPRDLETVCLKAMAKVPTRRYATAQELADDLRRYLRGEPIWARPVGRVERLWRWCRRNPVAAGLLLAVSLGSAFGLWWLSRLSDRLVRTSALESAAQQSEILDEVNNVYSAEVVERAKVKGVFATHDYATRPGTIPLPATLTIDLGRHLSDRGESGVVIRLYSDYPFRWRPDGGPRDDFERAALTSLRRDPATPYYSFEEFQGRPVLRYATARRMQESCVQCHNHNPDSPKRDWKEGDVRGVLEVIRPLDRDAARARDGLRNTLTLMAAISASLLGLTVLVLLAGNRRGQRPTDDARNV